MKRFFLLVIGIVFVYTLQSQAQTQYGIVKTRGRMVNGQYVRGEGLPGATVSIQGRGDVVVQNKGGAFSFSIPSQQFRISSVKKYGYQLIDLDAAPKVYNYSGNPIQFVMEKPEVQQAELYAQEKRQRRQMERRLQQREDSIESLNISLAEKNRLLQEIIQEREDNERIIKNLAEYYSTLDYDNLDEFQHQVNYYLENFEIQKADSLLRSRGRIEERINNAIKKKKLSEQLAASSLLDFNSITSDCYSFYQRFLIDHRLDSAAYYLKIRADIDTANVETLLEYGHFVNDYLAQYNNALKIFELAKKRAEQMYGETSMLYAVTLNDYATTLVELGNFEEALECLNRSLLIRREIPDTNDVKLAVCYLNIGHVLDKMDKREQAMIYYQKALNVATIVNAPEGQVASIYNNMGGLYKDGAQYEQALTCYKIAIEKQLSVTRSDSLDVSELYNNIAGVYHKLDSAQLALDYYEHAMRIIERELGGKHPRVATIYDNIATVYSDKGLYKNALEMHIIALDIRKEVYGDEHYLIAVSDNNIAATLFLLGLNEKALEYQERSLQLNQLFYGEESSAVANDYLNIGGIQNALGNLSIASDNVNKALTIYSKLMGVQHPDVGRCYRQLGDISLNAKDYEKSIGYYYNALSVFKFVYGENHTQLTNTYNNLSQAYSAMGNTEKTIECLEKALSIVENLYGKVHPYVAICFENIANEYYKNKKYDDSLEHMKQALAIKENIFGTDNIQVEPSYYMMGLLYQEKGDYINMLKYYGKYNDIMITHTPKESKAAISVNMLMYMAYCELIKQGNSEYKSLFDQFMLDKIWIAQIADENSPAGQQGYIGEYFLLEYSDWNCESKESIIEEMNRQQGKPKSIVWLKDGTIYNPHFDNTIGSMSLLKYIEPKTKVEIIKLYQKWRQQH